MLVDLTLCCVCSCSHYMQVQITPQQMQICYYVVKIYLVFIYRFYTLLINAV